MSSCPPRNGNLTLLAQGRALLERLTDEEYAGAASGRSSVGAQYRHVLDHYQLFLAGLGPGRVDYDARERDPMIEIDRAAAGRATERVERELARLGDQDLERPLRVRLAASPDEDVPSMQGSTVGRELLFLLSHTVHHFAIVRLLLEERGIPCDPDLGAAPSTLAYRIAVGEGASSPAPPLPHPSSR